MKLFLLFAMIFCHIVDDYYLQGILAQLKQKEWWKKNAPASMYKNDYKLALFMHAFSWSFMIMLPLVIYAVVNNYRSVFWYFYAAAMVINTSFHAAVDDQKANKMSINLLADQIFHLVQIVMTYFVFLII